MRRAVLEHSTPISHRRQSGPQRVVRNELGASPAVLFAAGGGDSSNELPPAVTQCERPAQGTAVARIPRALLCWVPTSGQRRVGSTLVDEKRGCVETVTVTRPAQSTRVSLGAPAGLTRCTIQRTSPPSPSAGQLPLCLRCATTGFQLSGRCPLPRKGLGTRSGGPLGQKEEPLPPGSDRVSEHPLGASRDEGAARPAPKPGGPISLGD